MPAPMLGFAMYEMSAGVGFILRLIIDHRFQAKGCGKAAMREVIRRLRLCPEAEIIATSYKRSNTAAAQLCAGLGFAPWGIAYAHDNAEEVFVKLPE